MSLVAAKIICETAAQICIRISIKQKPGSARALGRFAEEQREALFCEFLQ
jgi:hypothetical protein